MSEDVLIRGARVIDPAAGRDENADLRVERGCIGSIGKNLSSNGANVVEASGWVLAPGLIDLHTHLREPGQEYKETVESGVAAAVAGGFTTICCMPNTEPVNDNQSVTEFILDRARAAGSAHVLPVGAITKGSRGEELSEIGELAHAGCVAISDDGLPVMNGEVMRRALEYARIFDLPVIDHCEDLNLSAGGVMFEGKIASLLGLRGIPAASEEVMVARDIALAELTGGRVHLAHISTQGSVRLIREAKRRGIAVTAETCPHYFSLTEERVLGFDTSSKMKPPLASQADLEAIREGLSDGTLDAIATDHAPHAGHEKDTEFDRAPFGVIGLETALAVSLLLVEEGILTLSSLIEKFTVGPARVLKRPIGTLTPGAPADLILFDPGAEWRVEASSLCSKSKNSPFLGWSLKGRVQATWVGGRLVYEQSLNRSSAGS